MSFGKPDSVIQYLKHKYVLIGLNGVSRSLSGFHLKNTKVLRDIAQLVATASAPRFIALNEGVTLSGVTERAATGFCRRYLRLHFQIC